MSEKKNSFDDFDWEELLRPISEPKNKPTVESEPPKNEEAPRLEKIEPPKPAAPIEPPKPAAPTEPPKPVAPIEPPKPVAPIEPPKPAAPIEPQELAVEEQGFDDDEPNYELEREYLPIKPSRKGKIGCLGGMMYATFIISVSIILACLGWMFASDVLALNKPEVTATVTLPKTIFTEREVDVTDENGVVTGKKTINVADIDYVATQLKDAGIIEYKTLFKLYSSLSDADTKLDPGTYELSTIFDYRALVKKMTAGSPSQMTTKLTFPEGYTMEQIFTLLEEKDICSKEKLYDAAANYKFSYSFIDEEKLGDATRLEGYLFPDTYDFYEGERAYSVINKFLYNFYYRFTAEMIEKAEKRSLTVSELVTIASMIEREAGSDDDRAKIAAVIYNRIKQNMPLQIDATVQYILPERVPVLTIEHTQIDSPYNTYMYTGLPPAPIANPGMASINAALNPVSEGYLYYALDTETKSHRFFTNYYEHQAFVATQDYGG